jgi:hypothetical protein
MSEHEWISVRNILPKDCIRCLFRWECNDYGSENIGHYQVLYYDVRINKWSEDFPNTGEEKYLSEWYSVTHWQEIIPPKDVSR